MLTPLRFAPVSVVPNEPFLTPVVFVVTGIGLLVMAALAIVRSRRPREAAVAAPSTRRSRINVLHYGVEAGLVLAAAAIAAVFGTLSWTGVLVLSGAVLAALVLVRALLAPWLALLILVLVEVTNAGTLLPGFAGLNAYLCALALAAGALIIGAARRELRPVWTPLYLLAAVYLVTQLVTLLAAIDTGTGTADVVETAKDLIFLVVVTALFTTTRRQNGIAQALVLAMTVLAGLTIVNELLIDDVAAFGGFAQIPLAFDTAAATARHSGPQADPNFWARTLVLFLPLALSLWAAARAERRRQVAWLWLLAAAVLTGGVYLTQSRGGFASLVLVVLVWLVLAGRGYRRLLLLSPVALGLLLLLPGFGPRLATLGGLSAARSAIGEYSLVERVALQEVGLSIVAANPALGVGPGNFGRAFLDFRAESPVLPRVQDAPYFAHNLYLELTAEGGMVGLTGWLVLYGGAMLLAARALLLSPTVLSRWLSVGVLAGLLGWASASTFLHLAHFRVLAVVLALAAALDLQARPTAAVALSAAARAAVLTRVALRRGAWVGAAAAWCLVLVVGATTLGLTEPAFEARHSAVLLPTDDVASSWDAYTVDVLSRRPLMPTFANIVASPRFQQEAAERLDLADDELADLDVGVSGSPQSTAVVVTATSSDPALAEAMARGVLEGAREYVNSLDRLYGLDESSSSQLGPRQVQRVRWGTLFALLGGATAAAAIAFFVAARPRAGTLA